MTGGLAVDAAVRGSTSLSWACRRAHHEREPNRSPWACGSLSWACRWGWIL